MDEAYSKHKIPAVIHNGTSCVVELIFQHNSIPILITTGDEIVINVYKISMLHYRLLD